MGNFKCPVCRKGADKLVMRDDGEMVCVPCLLESDLESEMEAHYQQERRPARGARSGL
jgi:hypothetical protein